MNVDTIMELERLSKRRAHVSKKLAEIEVRFKKVKQKRDSLKTTIAFLNEQMQLIEQGQLPIREGL